MDPIGLPLRGGWGGGGGGGPEEQASPLPLAIQAQFFVRRSTSAWSKQWPSSWGLHTTVAASGNEIILHGRIGSP
eukprot:9192214-Pyramimonas_sp.AAC.1